jgi:hypothetical protein
MSELLKPPAVPAAILNFFASQPDFPALAGDMSEEFQQRAQGSGAKAAKRWFWREAFRNALALTWRELMRSPVRTTLMAIGCLLAVNAFTGVYLAIRWYFFRETPVDLLYRENPWSTLLLLNLIPPIAAGWTGGRLLRGREWGLALMFTVISMCINATALGYVLSVGEGHYFKPFEGLMIVLNLSRQGSFWLGALWARRSHLHSTDRRIEAAGGA